MTKTPGSPRKPRPSRATITTAADAQVPQSAAQPEPSDEQHSLAHIYDLRSVAMLGLPQGLRALIGDEAFDAMVARLESLELQMVLRPEGKVVFLAMPLVTFDQDKLGPLPEAEVAPASAAATVQPVPKKARKPRSAP